MEIVKCGGCEVCSVERGVLSVKCGVWSAKCGVGSVECGVWSVMFRELSVELSTQLRWMFVAFVAP